MNAKLTGIFTLNLAARHQTASACRRIAMRGTRSDSDVVDLRVDEGRLSDEAKPELIGASQNRTINIR
ncbi:hypothetical protein ACERK3_01650 [Phycisphaerales bacterium AB-hyl4]|uniref:Uncharacterized protein n=1 Tax=Natronomicrosphaera hydrolytica TaxID=3242702 RepID=A0ABV4U288_9BACT